MLKDILTGSEKSHFVLISDEADSSGRMMLLNFILEMINRDLNVVVCCVERPQQFFTSWLPNEKLNMVKFHDLTTDIHTEGNILEDLIKVTSSCSSKTAVVVDSLSIPLLMTDTPSVCRSLHRLKASGSCVCQVVSLLHRDVHEENTYSLLAHQASSVLHLTPGQHTNTQTCHITHSRPTGKVLKSAECFKIGESFLIENIQPLHKLSNANDQPGNKAHDPTAQLTFNLSLTSNEEEARRQLVLPYLKDNRSNEEKAPQSTIHYVADDVDDFDEEDPDDDLNI